MYPDCAVPCGPDQKVRRVVRTRSRAAARATHPWSTPIQIAVRPNPTDAILQGAPDALRSLIKPFAGLDSDQKKLNAVCCSVSSNWPVVICACDEGEAVTINTRRTENRRVRIRTGVKERTGVKSSITGLNLRILMSDLSTPGRLLERRNVRQVDRNQLSTFQVRHDYYARSQRETRELFSPAALLSYSVAFRRQ